MKEGTIERLGQIGRALGDETRLRILAVLASGETCVCHIYGAIGVPQPTASRHLAYLRGAGLVSARRAGLWVHYRLELPNDPALSAVDNAQAYYQQGRTDQTVATRASGNALSLAFFQSGLIPP